MLGEKGLRQLAAINHANAIKLADMLTEIPGVELQTETFFNEFTLKTPKPGLEVIDQLAERGVLGGVPAQRLEPDRPELANSIIVASTEVNTDADRAAYAKALREILS